MNKVTPFLMFNDQLVEPPPEGGTRARVTLPYRDARAESAASAI